jgi:hypothetical protein
MNLRFHDHHRRLQPLRRLARLFLGEGNLPARGGNAVTRKNGLGLVFVDLHL